MRRLSRMLERNPRTTMTAEDMRRIIAAKREGAELPAHQWTAIVADFVNDRLAAEQMSALLMAVYFTGMTLDETAALTRAMIDSGETLRYAVHPVLDKHSSGGVSDSVSLLAVPIAAAAGVHIAKLAGRGLGHTGGTIDKLEALPGMRTDLSPAQCIANVERIGCVIAAQSEKLVPADRKIYALRDRTGTVPSIGLIAASIVSKKIAAGADAIVYDVKYGSGAFMPDLASAQELANRISALTKYFGKRAQVYVTDMHEPLGHCIGDGLEALEALEILRGSRSLTDRLPQLALQLAQALITIAGVQADARALVANGAAYEKLLEMLGAQGCRVEELAALQPHATRATVLAPCDGFVTGIDPVFWGEQARALVERQGPFAGVELHVACGAYVEQGAILAEIFGDDSAVGYVDGVTLGPQKLAARPLIAAMVE